MNPSEESLISSHQSFPVRQRRSKKPAILTIIIVLVAAGAGYGGWWYGKRSADDNLSKITALQAQVDQLQTKLSAANEAASQAQAAQPDTTEATSSVSYLTIDQWGVKFELTSDITDATYSIKDNAAGLSTKALTKTDPQCAADKTTLGWLSRAEVDSTVNGKKVTDLYPNGKTIDGMYYYYVHPQATCSSNNVDQQQAASKAFQDQIADTLQSAG